MLSMENQNPKQEEANQLEVLDQKPKDKDHHHHLHHHHHQHHQNSPPSPLSSPSHEFSFTITLHPSPTSTPTSFKHSKNSSPHYSSSSSFALDLAPADDIFFHGHLLPLHLLSSLPPPSSTSPRPSMDTICIENCSLPLHGESINYHLQDDDHLRNNKKKPNSLSTFFGKSKWFKWNTYDDQSNNNKSSSSGSNTYKKKKAFDVKYYWRKYASMVEPLFSSKGEREKRDLRRRPYSFSGHGNPKERERWMKRRGEFSAPASMRTSPTNSGLLLATPAVGMSTSSESSMEELQNAIQAAIAHCKNSTTKKEDLCKR